MYIVSFSKFSDGEGDVPRSWSEVYKVLLVFVEHVLSILASLCRNLTGNHRSRLVQKFVEEDHIKVSLIMKFMRVFRNALLQQEAS